MLAHLFENRLFGPRGCGLGAWVANCAAVRQRGGPQPRLRMVALQLRVELLDLRLQLGDLVAEHPRTVRNRVRLFSKPRHDGPRFSGAGEPPAAWPKRAGPRPPMARSAPGPTGK